MFFADLSFESVIDTAVLHENKRKRDIATTVTISHDREICEYLGLHWNRVKTIGKIHRVGVRVTSDGQEIRIDETVYCISSRKLAAEEVAEHARNHW